MDTPAKTFYEQVVSICSCLPKKPKSANVSRDFWMPDHSCSVCYECDSQFTIFNRRHHCRVCGRIFCGNCSANSIPVPLDEPKTELEEEREERIRVCYYCFKQWEQETAANDNNRIQLSSPILSTSSSPISSHMIKSIAEGHINSDECDMTTLYDLEGKDIGPVDLEINGLLWLPPEPEDEEDEREDVLFDDSDGFLADEVASLPELPLKSPITVALPDKPSSIDGSISTIPGFSVPATGEAVRSQSSTGEGTSDLATLQQDGYNYHEELGSSKEDFPQGTPDHQSILVFLSSRCIWKGTVCERAHLFRIKYYGSSDKPLGRFLRDHLFDQSFRCRSCEMPSEAHVHSYTHQQGTLTISVKKLPELLLPGEREGKIWMWHRCLRCPRIDGFPPATRRVVMSDAAWGLSFGKFLELSFSNHAAASMVASCGHSLHRDCLRFYGFGRMVACFHYASIDVHSIYLPPSKLDFKYNNQEWIEKEVNKVNETCVRVYDGEVTSIIAFALISADYYVQLSDDRETPKDCAESSVSLPIYDVVDLDTNHLFDKTPFKVPSESVRALLYSKSLHANVSFTDVGPLGKVNYTVTCYFAKRFDALRRICFPSELDFTQSLARCKKWESQGGKRNVFFAKTLDDRFIIKQVTKAELEFFMQFAPKYFKYVSESIVEETPSCLAKILGIYQVTSKLHKGGMESRMDVLVMENLLFGRNVTRLYDLKGSSQSRYNPDASGSNKVLLDQNLIEAMATSPIFVGNKAKRLLERAIWNDTSFLESIDVMDYSLFVGVDEEKHELVVGTIDFLKQYTWDKHLETWVKSLGILGGPKNSSPTVISPKQYKKRFRKAMSEYFLMVPDQCSPPTVIRNGSQSDLYEENKQGVTSLE